MGLVVVCVRERKVWQGYQSGCTVGVFASFSFESCTGESSQGLKGVKVLQGDSCQG